MAKESSIVVQEVQTRTIVVALIGTTPLVMNRMSEKVRQGLLAGTVRKTAVEKQSQLKHNPMQEYRDSSYTLPDGSPTLLAVMSSAVKGAMKTAALDLPGTKKAQIGRLVFVNGVYTPVYGVPQIFMSVVRLQDIAHTPDVRTRAILPRWACEVSVRFVTPILNETGIVNLLAAGGITAGIGDGRPEKGKLSFGQFRVASPDDPEYLEIVRNGRDVQIAAMEEPECFDQETADLLAWFDAERQKRGK